MFQALHGGPGEGPDAEVGDGDGLRGPGTGTGAVVGAGRGDGGSGVAEGARVW